MCLSSTPLTYPDVLHLQLLLLQNVATTKELQLQRRLDVATCCFCKTAATVACALSTCIDINLYSLHRCTGVADALLTHVDRVQTQLFRLRRTHSLHTCRSMYTLCTGGFNICCAATDEVCVHTTYGRMRYLFTLYIACTSDLPIIAASTCRQQCWGRSEVQGIAHYQLQQCYTNRLREAHSATLLKTVFKPHIAVKIIYRWSTLLMATLASRQLIGILLNCTNTT